MKSLQERLGDIISEVKAEMAAATSPPSTSTTTPSSSASGTLTPETPVLKKLDSEKTLIPMKKDSEDMSATIGRSFNVSYRYKDADFLVLGQVPDLLRAKKPYTLDFLDDLLASEIAYKMALDLLINVYLKPLHKLADSTRDVPTNKELEGWFPEITSMSILSSEFITKLKGIVGELDNLESVLDQRLLDVLHYQFKFFNIFGAYGNRFSHTICTLKRRVDDLPKLKTFITVCCFFFLLLFFISPIPLPRDRMPALRAATSLCMISSRSPSRGCRPMLTSFKVRFFFFVFFFFFCPSVDCHSLASPEFLRRSPDKQLYQKGADYISKLLEYTQSGSKTGLQVFRLQLEIKDSPVRFFYFYFFFFFFFFFSLSLMTRANSPPLPPLQPLSAPGRRFLAMEHVSKLVIDKKGKIKLKKPLSIYVLTDIMIVTKRLKTLPDGDYITEKTDLFLFSPKNYKPRGTLELKEVIKRTQISNFSSAQRNPLSPP